MTARPQFSTLTREECETLLAGHRIARLAYSHKDRVDIEPIHYVYEAGWIYVRTQLGTKLSTIVHNPWVAFEIDESHALFDWQSVVVRGRLELLDDGPHDKARARHAAAVGALRGIVPEAFTPDDPTPDRTIIGAIYAETVQGRRATPGENDPTTGHGA